MMHNENEQPGLEVDRAKDTLEADRTKGALYATFSANKDNNRLEDLSYKDVPNTGGKRKLWNNPFGLRPFWFGVLTAIVTMIVVGAAIGGGVGAALADSSSKCPSGSQSASPSEPDGVRMTGATSASSISATIDVTPTTATATTTTGDYIPLAPSEVKLLQHPCPTENYLYQINDDPFPVQTFKWQCETAFLGNDRGDVGITIMQLSAYTAEQCVEACGGLNVWRNEQICSAVTFQASMSSEYNVGRGNCWLFNGTDATWDDPGAKTCISAYM
ncbi:uncharacterized protein Z518_02713 [Rhinocladiella mackenziei CBS 650.93]|uniref:Apple domain-containing protein n=1 Tax=Rhinocladiella mackenziei CBS 650.93 TaxID=1442369 RepID=A0A0D2HC99_9EURO|nr:uncharacterized protein Z518_02713 [Rhinocladiella mackenziei CBS 650.93]KIX08058.1 hypothetical protein Z518_02713 [Rhinocladiella mackenziei CBS 650.93]